jgi:hypothetical protein
MNGSYSIYGEKEKCMQDFGEETSGKKTFE